MKAVQFSRWMAQLSSLNPEQRDQLRSKLLPAARHWQDAIKAQAIARIVNRGNCAPGVPVVTCRDTAVRFAAKPAMP